MLLVSGLDWSVLILCKIFGILVCREQRKKTLGVMWSRFHNKPHQFLNFHQYPNMYEMFCVYILFYTCINVGSQNQWIKVQIFVQLVQKNCTNSTERCNATFLPFTWTFMTDTAQLKHSSLEGLWILQQVNSQVENCLNISIKLNWIYSFPSQCKLF